MKDSFNINPFASVDYGASLAAGGLHAKTQRFKGKYYWREASNNDGGQKKL